MPRRPAGSQPRRTRFTSLDNIVGYRRPISRGSKSGFVLHFGPSYLPGPFKEERACASNIDGSRFPRGSFGCAGHRRNPLRGLPFRLVPRRVPRVGPAGNGKCQKNARVRQGAGAIRLRTDRSKSLKVPPVRKASRPRLSSPSRRSPNRRSRVRPRPASWSSEPKAQLPSCIPTLRPARLSLLRK